MRIVACEDSLVDAVERAIDEPFRISAEHACAAILAVADWLQREGDISPLSIAYYQMSEVLRREVETGVFEAEDDDEHPPSQWLEVES